MADNLNEYLRIAVAAPFDYRKMDCFMFCLGWADVATGVQGIAQWVGRYDDMLSCRDFIARNGGMEKIAADFLMSTYGIVTAETSHRGNICLGRLGGIHAFMIRMSDADVTFKTEKGMTCTKRVTVLREWSVPCLS